MNPEIKNFIENQGWEYKQVVNNQLCIKTCSLCGDDRWKFYMNAENGCWDCKICGSSGSFYSLKLQLGEVKEISATTSIFANKQEISLEVLEEYKKNLKNSSEAMDYLTKTRGFTLETIEKFQLGLEGDYIVIPHFYQGKLWNCKFRNYKTKGFKRISGQPSLPFNLDSLDLARAGVVIVESETDAMAATQMGVKNVIGLTTGAQAFPPEWLKFIDGFKQIYVCLNSDSPGVAGSKKLIEKIGIIKCKNVLLPNVKDVNEYLLQEKTLNLEPFYNFVKTKATKATINEISTMSDYVGNLDSFFDSDGTLSGLNLPFTKTNKMLNGFKEEDLIILSGLSGQGKSTMVLNLLNEFLKNGKHCLTFFLEGKIFFYILRMMCIESGKSINELRNNKEEWEALKKQFASYPLYFYSGTQADINTKKIIDLSTSAAKLFDINFIAIDNIQKFVRDDRYVVQNTSEATKQLKNLAVDLKIPVLVIAHVRKPEKNKKRVTMYDAKNSSTIFQDCDVYLIIWDRAKEGALESDIVLTIEKNRMGEQGVDILMTFDKKIARFSERIEKLEEPKIPKKVKEKVKEEVKDDGWKSIVKNFENDSF